MRGGVIAVSVALAAAACSTHTTPRTPATSSADAWQPGRAVVVLVADVHPGTATSSVNVSRLAARRGVIAVTSNGGTLRLTFGRKALLTDMAALRLELAHTPGLSHVREVVVPPS